MIKYLPMIGVAFILAACSSQPGKNVISPQENLAGKKISNIRPVGVRLAKMPAPQASTQKAISKYQRFLEISPYNDTRVHVMHRLADLKLMDVEDLLADTPELLKKEQVQGVYKEAIDTYKRVLKLFPNRRDSDMLLYQLAKVYMLKGDTHEALNSLQQLSEQFPKSPLVVEAQYRRGDMLFYLGRFSDAEVAFNYVVSQKEKGRFQTSANYMRGWSQFKQRKYEAALTSFVSVIDSRFKDTTSIVVASKGDRELLDDTVRAMSMVFSADNGHREIVKMFKRLGSRHYEYLLYDALAEYYISKKQYTDAAKTYSAFVSANPQDVLASAFYFNIVKSYKLAGYVDQVLKHKKHYIERFGVNSQYWNVFDEDIKEMIRPNLKGFTSELAQFYHAKGQKSKSLKTKFNSLLTAARWYQEYIDTFPFDQKIGEMYFLKAEALYDIGQYEESIAAYVSGGFESVRHEKSEESAFASLVAYNQVIKKSNGLEKTQWLERKVDTALRFADVYPNNKNTVQVLSRAAEGLFALNKFSLAAQTSARVLNNPKASIKQKSVTYLIKGHSHFDLKEFETAESAFVSALALKQVDKKESNNVKEKIAASIYKQAVAWVDKGNLDKAVDEFMRVGKDIPNSPIRITAHYDAAAYLMKKKNWSRAEKILLEFREQFPKHKLALDVPSKLIIAYENMSHWKKAAFELQNIWRFGKNKNKQRIALYQAAEYYEKANDIDNAMAMLKRYAHNYAKPFDAQLESINKLESLYLKKADHEKRQYWLAKLITADKKAGKDRTDRSRFLAAKASFNLADYERQEYARIALTLPLKKSLAKKKVALKKTLDAYQTTAKMEVQEFTTAATFQIAEIYGQLSRDLMASQRPPNMSELELEEYDYLLEDQAFPFEEAAINIHETNIKRSWDGLYDDWISKSIGSLSKLMPARYGKQEIAYDVISEIH